jgi:hypothetical protein
MPQSLSVFAVSLQEHPELLETIMPDPRINVKRYLLNFFRGCGAGFPYESFGKRSWEVLRDRKTAEEYRCLICLNQRIGGREGIDIIAGDVPFHRRLLFFACIGKSLLL